MCRDPHLTNAECLAGAGILVAEITCNYR